MKQFLAITIGLWCNRSDVGFMQLLTHQGWRFARKWLRRPTCLAGHIAFWNAALLYGEKRFPSKAVENEHESHLRHLRNRRNFLSMAPQAD